MSFYFLRHGTRKNESLLHIWEKPDLNSSAE